MRYCETCGAAFRSTRSCPKDGVTTRADVFDPLLGRVLGDRYRVLEKVGAGAMGQVYKAAHKRIACIFAVKVLYGDLAYDAEMLSRFLREAELASCLQSRHIVRVTDFGNEDGALPYIVMEYLDGPSLHDVISGEGALAPERAALITQRIARGLGHAHDRGVIHRDLKPENVALVTEDDERDVVKLLDFGVARMRDGDRLTVAGTVVGTPLYMSPEQLTGQDLDARSDLYSLGICLYEMLAGKPPFDGKTMGDLARQHIHAPVPSLRQALEQRGGATGLDAVVQRLLAKRREDRPGSAREVVEAVTEALAGRGRAGSLPPPSSASATYPSAALVRTAIEQAIQLGAPRYNAGDHAGCYELYRSVATELTQEVRTPVAIVARLQSALDRARTRTSATDAAWDMRYAFDDILTVEPFALLGDPLADDLALYRAVCGRREAEGAFDTVGDYATAFARALADKLRPDARRAPIVAALDDATRRAAATGGAAAALPEVGPVLARLAGGQAAQSFGTSLVVPPADFRSQSLVPDDVRACIVRAIRIGAPAFNEGRADVCARVYRDAAREVIDLARGASRSDEVVGYVEKAVREASGRAPSDAAWILRGAFDAVLAAR